MATYLGMMHLSTTTENLPGEDGAGHPSSASAMHAGSRRHMSVTSHAGDSVEVVVMCGSKV